MPRKKTVDPKQTAIITKKKLDSDSESDIDMSDSDAIGSDPDISLDSQDGGSESELEVDKDDFESDEENLKTSDSDDDDDVACAAKYADEDEDDSILNDMDDVDSKLLEELDIPAKSDNKIIPPTKRITKPFMTKYERVRLISDRARQLADGAKPLIKDVTGLSSKDIAILELNNNIIPLIIERPLPNGYKEVWKVKELIH